MNIKRFIGIGMTLFCLASVDATDNISARLSATLSVKTPGNDAVSYNLSLRGGQWVGTQNIPLLITQSTEDKGDGKQQIHVRLTAQEDVYFNYGMRLKTGYQHDDCLFLMPGFWYRRNMRSPGLAPSFHTSDSWIVREDRLSTPLTAAFDGKIGTYTSVIRLDKPEIDALTALKEGDVILSGETSVGYTGFNNVDGETVLSFGFPYEEAPKTYIRKLTLAPRVRAFELLKKGDSVSLTWEISTRKAPDFSACVQRVWEYSYDTNKPQPVGTPYSPDSMKAVLSNYFVESYVGDSPIRYYSGQGLHTDSCEHVDEAEVGFIGRTLLNAFNALEYGEQQGRVDLVANANSVLGSYLNNGFSDKGFFNEVIQPKRGFIEPVHSIRRQSEGVYAILYYLDYEKRHGRSHIGWENHVKTMLGMFLRLQKNDGSFPRKFMDNLSEVDSTGGSTPSATLPLVLAYKYFKDKRYLAAAKRTIDYLEKAIISNADYFSSTLDANCEDKEASLYASTAAYYMALVTKGAEREHYASLAKKAAYFALSWYHTRDVPFAQGQMLGDLGFKSRGWGNVSVENNHIDVFVFDFGDVLNWLAKRYDEPRFSGFANVISTSMRQLLPVEGHLCGVAKVGFYPEVVQHTNWDYGRNGKGFYNDVFAPGWTVASLWELFSPGRAERFLSK